LLVVHLLVEVTFISGEYVSEGDLPCRETCDDLEGTDKAECLREYMEFYSYKLVNSMFNYGKVAIYAGLWASRYEQPDLDLFKNVFIRNLELYNSTALLGSIPFEDLNKTASFVFAKFEQFTLQRSEADQVPYESYPSLKCPVPCTYELLTWKTLFGLSAAICVLCLITISLYSIFLRKQYIALKSRLKNIKYSKVVTSQSGLTPN
jgi:hypothetical protein